MTSRFSFCFALFLLSSRSLSLAQTSPNLDQILLQLQQHVAEFEYSLPNFMCNEKITSQIFAGRAKDQTIVNSIFIGTQHKDENGRPFTESREIKTINGRPAGKNQQLRLPFFYGGGFSSVLDASFGSRNVPYHDYKLAGTEKIDGKTALVIRFETRKDQKEVTFEFFGNEYISKDTGKAWIDPESMQVIRLERRYGNVPLPYGVMVVSVDYAKVVIAEKTFWMPSTVRVEETQPKFRKPLSGRYMAEYSGYQKFDVSVRMKY